MAYIQRAKSRLVPESLTPNQIDLIIFGDALGALIYVKDARITE
ncbi:hypothetical protein ABVL1U2_490060 [Acinetobacter baumannii]|nr:hypothetical protein ABVL1U2_490060 [Acinetobacter baumannii]